MVVQDHMATPKLTEAFIQSGMSMGYHHVDINGENQIGKSPFLFPWNNMYENDIQKYVDVYVM